MLLRLTIPAPEGTLERVVLVPDDVTLKRVVNRLRHLFSGYRVQVEFITEVPTGWIATDLFLGE